MISIVLLRSFVVQTSEHTFKLKAVTILLTHLTAVKSESELHHKMNGGLCAILTTLYFETMNKSEKKTRVECMPNTYFQQLNYQLNLIFSFISIYKNVK